MYSKILHKFQLENIKKFNRLKHEELKIKVMEDLKEIDLNNYEVLKQLDIKQYNRITRLKKLGFKETVLGVFKLNDFAFTLNFLQKEESESAISNVVIELSSSNRSCFNCKLSTVCYAFKELKETIKYLPSNIDSNDAPMKQIDVFKALAGCCLVYEENN